MLPSADDPAAGNLAVVALGSNQGDRAALLRQAAARVEALGRPVARSFVYETPPVGPPQPDYLNAVVLVRCALEPLQLLRQLQAIEASLGRVRAERWGPRTIDIDLVAFGPRRLTLPELELPHPRAHERAFVLVPLADVAPDFVLPGRGSVRALLDRLPASDKALRRVPGLW